MFTTIVYLDFVSFIIAFNEFAIVEFLDHLGAFELVLGLPSVWPIFPSDQVFFAFLLHDFNRDSLENHTFCTEAISFEFFDWRHVVKFENWNRISPALDLFAINIDNCQVNILLKGLEISITVLAIIHLSLLKRTQIRKFFCPNSETLSFRGSSWPKTKFLS